METGVESNKEGWKLEDYNLDARDKETHLVVE